MRTYETHAAQGTVRGRKHKSHALSERTKLAESVERLSPRSQPCRYCAASIALPWQCWQRRIRCVLASQKEHPARYPEHLRRMVRRTNTTTEPGIAGCREDA